MKKFIIRCASHPDGREFLDLEFNVRPGRYSDKWVECIRSIQGIPPYDYQLPIFGANDPGVYQQRIISAVAAGPVLAQFLQSQGITDFDDVNQHVINTIHRFVEHNKSRTDLHLGIHNDIHLLEGAPLESGDLVMRKLKWVPPGLVVDMEYDDYLDYTTEPCKNFIQADFSHVGRSPHNSFLTCDDTSLETSCVIQHKVNSGAEWYLGTSHHVFDDVQGFRDWVSENQEFFRTRWGIETNTDPRLCFGRIILATGAEDYTKIDKTFKYITSVFIS